MSANYLKCCVCGAGILTDEDRVARPLRGTFYFGHRECMKMTSNDVLLGPQQMTIEEAIGYEKTSGVADSAGIAYGNEGSAKSKRKAAR